MMNYDFHWNWPILFLVIYASVITGVLIMSFLRQQPTKLPSPGFNYDDDPRPNLQGKIILEAKENKSDKKQIKIRLKVTNEGKQTAYDTKAIWYDGDMNWYQWKSSPPLHLRKPHLMGNLRPQESIEFDLECEIDYVAMPGKSDIFFCLFSIEFEFRQSNGESCLQEISWFNYAEEYDFLESSNVLRYFD
ncbi:MAG: hypothetical protein V4541_09095 [Bacteroidota bacterium]